MDMTDKSAQPSMEEILASIRKLLSEESEPAREAIDFNARPIMIGDEDEDEASEFDLPAIFRSSTAPTERTRGERAGASLGRLTDAIRSVTGGMVAHEADAASLRAAGEAAKGLSSLKIDDQAAVVTALHDRPLELAEAAAPLEDVSFFEPVQGEAHHSRSHLPSFEQAVTSPAPAPAAAAPAAAVAAPSEPLRVTASSEPRDVQRVMAPFKDTKFRVLSSPAAPSEPVAEARPQQAQPQVQPKVAVQPQAAPVEPKRPDPYAHKKEPELPGYAPRAEAKQGLAASFPQAAHAHREEAPQAQGIEEAAADLLRPMLRHWLAENMPKMVEKALVLEMQQQLGNLKKSGGTES